MITKQRLITELKLFLEELKKSNAELEAEAKVRRDILRIKHYIQHPDELPITNGIAGRGGFRGANSGAQFTTSHMFMSESSRKRMKQLMFAMFFFVLSLPVTLPLMVAYQDHVQSEQVSYK